jgi:hypothetical protein
MMYVPEVYGWGVSAPVILGNGATPKSMFLVAVMSAPLPA